MVGKVVSVLNMKGGVGKTTISAHLFRVFYLEKKKKVLLIDMDPQFNLSQCLLEENEYDVLASGERHIIRCFEPAPVSDFFEIKTTAKAPPMPEELISRQKVLAGGKAYLDLIAGSFDLVKYSLIDNPAKLTSALSYFKRFISQARGVYDLVVIDCNPSSSFITKCALKTSTHILSPVRPDKYSVQGVKLVNDLLARIVSDEKPEQLILMNGVPRGSAPGSVENDLRASVFGANVLGNRLPTTSLLAANPSYTGFATDKKVAYKGVLLSEMKAISNELAGRLGV